MRIIITGGTGFIGSRLVSSLAQDGHDVVVLTRSPEKRTGELPAGVRLTAWDGETAQGWGHLANGAGAIVNLAGENLATIWTRANKRKIMESRMNAGKAVVEAVQQATEKPGLVVQSSAVGYYGPRGDEIITEDSPAGNDFLAEVCKRWEASTAEVEAMGVRRVILRTGLPLDPGGGVLPKFLLPFRMFAGGPLGSGKQYIPWLHILDQIRAMRFLINHESASGPYNISAPNPVPNRQFAQVLGKTMKRPAILPAPAFAIRLALGEMSMVVLTGQRAVPARLEQAGFDFRFEHLASALEDLL